MVKCIDDNVGKILDALRAAGLLERTIVVFTADHGDLRGEHHRQNKGVPYEGSAKIPFVIYAPGRIQSGTVVTQTLGCVDFLPTVLSLMGCPTGDHEQGRNASALLTSGTAPDNWVDVTFIRSTSGGSTWLGVVSDRYKLIFSPHDDPWLFDLQKDPDELTNFLRDSACRAMIRELSRELVAYAREFADPYAADPKVKADLEWAVSGVGPYVSTAPAKTSRKAGGAKRANQGKRRAKKSVKQ